MNSFQTRYLAKQPLQTLQEQLQAQREAERKFEKRHFEKRHLVLGVIGGCCATGVMISGLLQGNGFLALLMTLSVTVFWGRTLYKYLQYRRKYGEKQ